MVEIAGQTEPVWALGTMSGTSLDGIDAAMILTDGDRVYEFGPTAYRPYGTAEREVLRAALGHWDGLDQAAAVVEAAHLDLLREICGAAIVGFHGQTTAHDPGNRRTCQIGDGRHLAHALDCPVVWDFRSADVAEGGQGAPLAPFYHHAVMRYLGRTEPVAVLNLGGVGNLTWVDPRIEGPAEPGACLAFDTGPANAPLNDLMQVRLGVDCDEGGSLASSGVPDGRILARLASEPFFSKRPPKSLDRDAFAWLSEAVTGLPDADAAATLTRAAVDSAAAGLAQCPGRPSELLITGGGRKNLAMMRMLREAVAGTPVRAVDEVGLDGDMLEAQAFAYLAVRAMRGWPLTAPGTTGVHVPLGGGQIAHPGDAIEQLRHSA